MSDCKRFSVEIMHPFKKSRINIFMNHVNGYRWAYLTVGSVCRLFGVNPRNMRSNKFFKMETSSIPEFTPLSTHQALKFIELGGFFRLLKNKDFCNMADIDVFMVKFAKSIENSMITDKSSFYISQAPRKEKKKHHDNLESTSEAPPRKKNKYKNDELFDKIKHLIQIDHVKREALNEYKASPEYKKAKKECHAGELARWTVSPEYKKAKKAWHDEEIARWMVSPEVQKIKKEYHAKELSRWMVSPEVNEFKRKHLIGQKKYITDCFIRNTTIQFEKNLKNVLK